MKVRRLDCIVMSTALMLVSFYNLLVITGVVRLSFASMANIIVILCSVVLGIRSLVLPIMNPEKVYGIPFGQSGRSGKVWYLVSVFMSAIWVVTNIVLMIKLRQAY